MNEVECKLTVYKHKGGQPCAGVDPVRLSSNRAYDPKFVRMRHGDFDAEVSLDDLEAACRALRNAR